MTDQLPSTNKINKASLREANKLLREGNYTEALSIYKIILTQSPWLKNAIAINVNFAERRLKESGIDLNKITKKTEAFNREELKKILGIDDYTLDIVLKSTLFDEEWYVNKYKLKNEISIPPLEHYLKFGVQLGFNPSEYFDTNYYLTSNQDVKEASKNPFVHYVSQGVFELGRNPLPPKQKKYISRYSPSPIKYVPRDNSNLDPVKKNVKAIAFYLPQFHRIQENDMWWGNGFTEWTNVKPALPQFKGHYQPHIPDEYLGYYNLLDGETQHKQVEIAKQYGLDGFCFYLYWFSGKRLLEKPIDNYLTDKTLELPFCICWANENWSRRWDGLDNDLLMVQNYSDEDDLNFIQNISKYLLDKRYIRIDNKPLLLIYRPNLFPNMAETSTRWRDWCRSNNIGEIYLAYPQSFECVNPNIYGFDAAIEFPPNNSEPPDITRDIEVLNNDFEGVAYDWRILLERSDNYKNPGYKLFRSVCPSWDNTARKKNKGTSFLNSCPDLFKKWLVNAFTNALSQPNKDERIVFINAWNEWAEGAHLEPDNRYGFAWLKAIKDAQEECILGNPKHRDLMNVQWRKIEKIFNSKIDKASYPFIIDYLYLFQSAVELGTNFICKNGVPSYKLKDEIVEINSRNVLSKITPELNPKSTICFVILQFNKSELTIKCVESIQKISKNYLNTKIVIVDNGSKKDDLEKIKNNFKNSKNIFIVESKKNLGFSKGNNLGYKFARENLNASLIIVLNNDTEIHQEDFLNTIIKLYKDYSYSILGPDIFIPDGRHENPYNDFIYGLEEWEQFSFQRTEEKKYFETSGLASFNKIGSSSPQSNIIINPILQGAAIIISPLYLLKNEIIFDERLFLYGEEFLLSIKNLFSGHLTIYSNELKVFHLEGSTTKEIDEAKKIKIGYESSIKAINYCIEHIVDFKKYIHREPLNDDDFEGIKKLTSSSNNSILVDLFFCQPGFHGAGEYGKAIFKELVAKMATNGTYQLVVAANKNLFIDKWIWELCEDFAIPIINVNSYNQIINIVNLDLFNSFFTPAIVVYTGYEYMKKVGDKLPFTCKYTKIFGTLHDIRDYELALSKGKILESRRKLGCLDVLNMPESEIHKEIEYSLDLASKLKVMYKNIIEDVSIEKIITISQYCHDSIINNIGLPSKPLKVLMSPMKSRPDPEPFEDKYKIFDHPYILIINAGREEKNAASAIRALDFFFNEVHNSPLNVILTGLENLNNLGLSNISNISKFICIGEVLPPQFEFLLKNAECLIYPSLNEGLGYPPIEAMYYGVPSLVSKITAIPEVCGEKSVLYFDPYDYESILESLRKFFAKGIDSSEIANQFRKINHQQKKDLHSLVNLITSIHAK